MKDGKEPAAVEAAVYEEIETLQKEPVPAEELQKVKNQAKANAYRRLSSPFFIDVQLLLYDGLGDWRYINTSADKVDAVTAADLQRVAREYLTAENRTVGVFLRKEGAASGGPRARGPARARAGHGEAEPVSRSRQRRTRRSCGRASPRCRRRPDRPPRR